MYEFVNEEDNLSVDITFMTQLQGMSIVGHDDSVNMFTLRPHSSQQFVINGEGELKWDYSANLIYDLELPPL